MVGRAFFRLSAARATPALILSGQSDGPPVTEPRDPYPNPNSFGMVVGIPQDGSP